MLGALFIQFALACMGLETTLFGYSERQDRVVQYALSLETECDGRKTRESLKWVDYLFSREPSSSGVRKFEIDYRGGTLDSYDVRYDREVERFEGTVRRAGEQ